MTNMKRKDNRTSGFFFYIALTRHPPEVINLSPDYVSAVWILFRFSRSFSFLEIFGMLNKSPPQPSPQTGRKQTDILIFRKKSRSKDTSIGNRG